MNVMFGIGGALIGLVHGLSERDRVWGTWRSVLLWTILGLLAGLMLHGLLIADWSSNGPPQDRFG